MTTIIITAIVALCIGYAIAYIILRFSGISIIKKATAEAEMIKKNKNIEAKEKFIALKLEHDKMVQEQQKKQQQAEDRLRQREQQLNQRQGDLQRLQNENQQQKQKIDQQLQSIEFKQRETEKMHKQALQQLETLSGMSAEEAKAYGLVDKVESII